MRINVRLHCGWCGDKEYILTMLWCLARFVPFARGFSCSNLHIFRYRTLKRLCKTMAKVYGRNSNILVNYARESEMIYATNKSTPLLMWYHWYDDMWYNQWCNDIIDNMRIFLSRHQKSNRYRKLWKCIYANILMHSYVS